MIVMRELGMVETKDVTGYEDRYTVSDNGLVFSKKRNKAVTIYDNGNVYLKLMLWRGGKIDNRLVHRLVAEHFLDDWSPTLQVDHIDGDKTNNHVSNLRMVTQSQNMKAKLKPRGKSKYRGVNWNVKDKVFHAQISPKGKTMHIGTFRMEVAAALAWDEAARKFGYFEEAMNFPNNGVSA